MSDLRATRRSLLFGVGGLAAGMVVAGSLGSSASPAAVAADCGTPSPSLTPTLTPTPTAPAVGVDPFGIKQIQPSIDGGMNWVSNWTASRKFDYDVDPTDPWFDCAHGDGSYVAGGGLLKISGEAPRMYVHDPAGVKQWRDVEVTTYFMRVSDSSPAYAGMEAVARTSHLKDTLKCDSRGVDARMRVDGHIDFEKETAHPDSTAVANKTYWPGKGGMPKNIWIGYKYLCYDLPNGDTKLELWTDTTDGANGGTWVKINEFTDNGTNMGGSTACKSGIDSHARLTNAPTRAGSETGQPNSCVYFRSDSVNTNGLVFKKASVREIQVS